MRCLGPEVVSAYFYLRTSKIDQFNEQVKLKVIIVNLHLNLHHDDIYLRIFSFPRIFTYGFEFSNLKYMKINTHR